MSSNLESNKIFAAILVAGITAMLSGFIAHKLVHPHELEEDAVAIEGSAVASSGAAAKPQVPEPILHLIAAADVDKGKKLSKACAACHSFDKGGPNKVGPNLWNTVLGPKGHIDGFAYSDALIAKGGAWSYESLNFFFWKPKKYIPGTKMNYIGLKKPEDRAALIAWLGTLSDSPPAPPSAAEIAAEKAAFAPEVPDAPLEDAIEGASQVLDEAVDAVQDTAEDLVDDAVDALEDGAAN